MDRSAASAVAGRLFSRSPASLEATPSILGAAPTKCPDWRQKPYRIVILRIIAPKTPGRLVAHRARPCDVRCIRIASVMALGPLEPSAGTTERDAIHADLGRCRRLPRRD